MASNNKIKVFVVSEDSTEVENIVHCASIYDHKVISVSRIPNAMDHNVKLILIDGNIAREDNYVFLELVSKTTPVVVIVDPKDCISDEEKKLALKKGAIEHWYSPIDKETYDRIEVIMWKKSCLLSNKKRNVEVEEEKEEGEGETSTQVNVEAEEVEGIGDKKRVVNDSPPAGLYPIEGGGSIRYVETPGLHPKKP